MKLLILGGTVFLGRHLVGAALAGGHEVTLFNRGRSSGSVSPDVEQLRGDREGRVEGLAALRGRRWDLVIDTSGYTPGVVRASAKLLADAVEHYTFISSISVYADVSRPGITEADAVGALPEGSSESEVTGATYGPLKVLCERAAEDVMPGRVLNIRPGLIVGPYDPSDRFTYWPARAARGGAILAPGRPERQIQQIDARDLAEWVLTMAERREAGVYNATGPESPLSFGELLETCIAESGSAARVVWVSEPFLLEQGVQPWQELPLWIPEQDPAYAGFNAVDCRRAFGAGLRCRPLAETVRDTLAWQAQRPVEHVWRAGLAAEREADLLQAWEARG